MGKTCQGKSIKGSETPYKIDHPNVNGFLVSKETVVLRRWESETKP